MSDDYVSYYELEEIQAQIWDLESTVRDLMQKVDSLQMENTLLRNDLTIIKNEGCWRFVENLEHKHKDTK